MKRLTTYKVVRIDSNNNIYSWYYSSDFKVVSNQIIIDEIITSSIKD